MPIGRLDEKSEGLLLMTTDGKLSDHINRNGIEKEYYALVDGVPTEAQLEQLSQGIEIGINGKKYRTKPCVVKILEASPALPDRGKKIRDARHGPTTWLSITIIEGKFRQVRKMTSAIDCPTLRLVRVRVGNLKLNAMQPGDVYKTWADISKAKRLLNYNPRFNIYDGLQEFVDWYKSYYDY